MKGEREGKKNSIKDKWEQRKQEKGINGRKENGERNEGQGMKDRTARTAENVEKRRKKAGGKNR